jgi:hypothetical protein
LLNFKAKPDFIAYDVNAKGFIAPNIQRLLYKVPMAAWTVREMGECEASLSRGEMPIFENFTPGKR